MTGNRSKRRKIAGGVTVALGLSLLLACPFDDTLRAYLHRHFWMPFTKRPNSFERPKVRRVVQAFAGMSQAGFATTLERLRGEYRRIAQPQDYEEDQAPSRAVFLRVRAALAAAQADPSLKGRDREEVELLDAKIDLREGMPEAPELFHSAKRKLQRFLQKARISEFRSEARGWLARVHYLLGEQTAAGKIYLDELNLDGSNLSRESVLNSLAMTYGRDGGPELRAHIAEYFDTPEHAAFAIQMLTNPRPGGPDPTAAATYRKIKSLLETNASLLGSNRGSNALALLSMRTALRLGEPDQAREIAQRVPAGAEVRAEPEFDWMLAASHFLTHDFAGAEQPLLSLFRSRRATSRQKAAAAYALCGVYFKTANPFEQLRFALWLRNVVKKDGDGYSYPSAISDMSIYLALSGWDLNLILEFGAPIETLQRFVAENPGLEGIREVRYALAVRLAREDRYQESAEAYTAAGAGLRAQRMRHVAGLYQQWKTAANPASVEASKYAFAAFLAANSDRVYFNDSIWDRLQNYALLAETDARLTKDEREAMLSAERKLRDDQEERWKAYRLLREVARDSNGSETGKRAAMLGVECLRRISGRFGRADEIRKGDIELSRWIRDPRSPLPAL